VCLFHGTVSVVQRVAAPDSRRTWFELSYEERGRKPGLAPIGWSEHEWFRHFFRPNPIADPIEVRCVNLRFKPFFSVGTGVIVWLGWIFFAAPWVGAWTEVDEHAEPVVRMVETVQNVGNERSIVAKVGIDGRVRLGCWTELRVTSEVAPGGGEMVIRAMDSDGNWVNYRWPLERAESLGSELPTYVGLFRLGRDDQPIEVTILDSSGAIWASRLIPVAGNSELRVHAANDRLWLYLGTDVDLRRSLGWVENDQQAGAYQLVNLTDASSLPVTVWGWDSVERLVSCTDGQTWPQEISEGQRQAIGQWLVSGGRISLAMTRSSEALFGATGPFRAWIGDLKMQPATTKDSSQIELFVTSRSQLIQDPAAESLEYVWFDSDLPRAILVVDGRPVLTRSSCGLGQLDLLGFDPAGELLTRWPSRGALLIKWLDYRRPESVRLATAFGYSDVTGRMRSALEQFGRVRVISFTVVALIILGFVVLLIADYFFLKHVLRDMKWAWVTLPICCAVACSATWILYRSSKPDTYQLNQSELIDIDGTGGYEVLVSDQQRSSSSETPSVATGRVWASLYSPDTQTVDLRVGSVNQLPLTAQDSTLGWLGLPGAGLGGMQSENKLSGTAGTYEIVGRWDSASVSGRPLLNNRVVDMPMNVASSRVLTGMWSAEFAPLRSDLRRQPGRDRLMGTFTNPLPVELKDCLIVYGGWGYRLSRPLGPGESIDLDAGRNQAKPESFESWLRRPNSNLDDLYRNLEMLMYYEQSGGSAQTRLLQGYQSRVDLSHLSRLDRAVLIGRHDGNFADLRVNDQSLEPSQLDRKATMFRIIFPVSQAEQPSSRTP
jgi:hypothetical protein